MTESRYTALAHRECERRSGEHRDIAFQAPVQTKQFRRLVVVLASAFLCIAVARAQTPSASALTFQAHRPQALSVGNAQLQPPFDESGLAYRTAQLLPTPPQDLSVTPERALEPSKLERCSQPPSRSALVAEAKTYYENLAADCLRSAGFYRMYGQWLLQQGNPDAAVEALERSLLLDPEHLGTQLDYAQALIVLGDSASATNILSELQTQPDVPPSLASLLAGQLQALQQVAAGQTPEDKKFSSRVMLSQSAGRDSNLNNATTASNVILTYPTADLDLPLLAASRPQSGAMASSALQWTGLLPYGRQVWLFQAKGQVRHTNATSNRYQQAEFDVTWLQDPAAARQWIGRAEHTQFVWAGKKLYTSEKIAVQHQWAHNTNDLNCRTALGAELENRVFPGSQLMDGRYRGAILTWVCQKQDSFSIQLRTGVDQPRQADRVGGDQRQNEIRLQWQFDGLGNQWQTEYSYQRQQDASGYSPLLSRNAIRRVSRQALRLETSRPTNWAALGSPQWFGSLERTYQTSNLQLFASSRSAMQTGLRWLWP